ncbi:hypothetical protein J4456_01915 [Candidatus Pacearchaeota archaeon]|nr:hypothetical protein [Candidatus Pacearchaeota archaeon]
MTERIKLEERCIEFVDVLLERPTPLTFTQNGNKIIIKYVDSFYKLHQKTSAQNIKNYSYQINVPEHEGIPTTNWTGALHPKLVICYLNRYGGRHETKVI